jgi:hypothetical protein
MDMIDAVDDVTAYILLDELEKYWYDYPDNHDDVKSWYSVIRKLIKHIHYYGWNDQIFRNKHPHLVVCEKPTNNYMRNRRKQALVWRELHSPDSQMVQDSFYMLGYHSLEYLCEEDGGFSVTRAATEGESSLEQILRNAVSETLSELELPIPICRIIQNESSVYQGTAHCMKRKKQKVNMAGLRIRYDLDYIELKGSLFEPNQFMNAFATYCHELCHCFGGDASSSFSLALTEAIALIVQHQTVLDKYHSEWSQYFEEQEKLVTKSEQ